jgi:ubiquinone/menaquinone biosynthesis C-methylase UbiE
MSPGPRLLAPIATATLLLAACAVAQTQAPPQPGTPSQQPGTDPPGEINRQFQNPDAAEWVKKFESESREVYTHRSEIVKAAGVVPGMAVADVGAGTGLFTMLFAERVGPKGKVYAVDVSPPFLKHIAEQAKTRGLVQIQAVQASQDSINLPAGSVDLVYLSDTYHHLEKPERVLAAIHRALRFGGRLIVVEFDRRAGVSTAFILKHVRADKARFIAEITAAGFEPIKNPDPPRLKENFFAEFRRVEPAPGAP